MSKSYIMEEIRYFTNFPNTWVVGVDPDLHTPAWCLWGSDEPYPNLLMVARIPSKIKGQDCAAYFKSELQETCSMRGELVLVEGQRVRRAKGHETINPQSLVDLAAMAGACLTGGVTHLMVEPSTWKGSTKKHISQARILARIPGTEYKFAGSGKNKYAYPTTGPLIELGKKAGLRKSDWKHVVDAIGIAQWGIKQIKEIQKRDRILARAKSRQ